jgi:hypothetical protein
MPNEASFLQVLRFWDNLLNEIERSTMLKYSSCPLFQWRAITFLSVYPHNFFMFKKLGSRSYFTTDGQSVSQSVSMSWCRAPLWGPWPDFSFSFLLPENYLLFVLGWPLWGEDGSVICSAVCQWSESRRTLNHILLSHLRLLVSLPVASYDSQGLRWKYSYPPPHEN